MRKILLAILILAMFVFSACSSQQVTIKSATVESGGSDVASDTTDSAETTAPVQKCIDTDAVEGNGRQPTWPGVVTAIDGTFKDKCKDLNNIIEVRCLPNGQKGETILPCGDKKRCLAVGESVACVPLTCRDRAQGMDEEGVDCGPICGKKCSV